MGGPEEFARATQFEVGLGDAEAVGGLLEDGELLGTGIFLGVAHEDAVAFVGAAADAPAQLVELR